MSELAGETPDWFVPDALTPPAVEARLKEIEARAGAATPGPWRPDYDWRKHGGDQVLADQGLTVAFIATPAEEHEGDTGFIAAAREDVPWLLEQVRAALRREAALKAALSEYCWRLYTSGSHEWLECATCDAMVPVGSTRRPHKAGCEIAALLTSNEIGANDGSRWCCLECGTEVWGPCMSPPCPKCGGHMDRLERQAGAEASKATPGEAVGAQGVSSSPSYRTEAPASPADSLAPGGPRTEAE